MFDPHKHIKNLADDAYQAGRNCADALVQGGAPIDEEFLDQTRDALCGALLRAVKANGYFAPDIMPAVHGSALSGFEDRRRELIGATAPGPLPPEEIPPEDAEAIEQVGAEIIASMRAEGFDTGLFDKPQTRRGENGRAQPRHNGRWIKMTWIDKP